MEIIIRFVIAFGGMLLLTRWLIRNDAEKLTTWQLVFALTASVAMGCLYGYIFKTRYNGDDTWAIHQFSLEETDKLLHRTGDYFEDINLAPMLRQFGWQEGWKMFKDKLELALLIKPLSVFNLYSKGNYYINTIAFNALVFWGHYWLYRLVAQEVKEKRNWWYLLIFLFPPALFWFSGLRADGLLLVVFSGTLWWLQQWFRQGKAKYLLVSLLLLGLMAVVREAFVLVLAPGLLAWGLKEKFRWSAARSFAVLYGIGILLFCISSWLPLPYNLPAKVVERKQAFEALQGKTRVAIGNLEPNPVSFIRHVPAAIDNVFFRPYPQSARGLLQWMTVAENIFIICSFFIFIFYKFRYKEIVTETTWINILFYFGILSCLSIGYTIPFPGAMVRYRALPELCLLLGLLLKIAKSNSTDYVFSNVYKKSLF